MKEKGKVNQGKPHIFQELLVCQQLLTSILVTNVLPKKTKSKNRMVKSSKPTTPPNAPNSVAVPTLNAPQIQKDELMTIDFSTTPDTVQIKFVPDDDIEHVIILK